MDGRGGGCCIARYDGGTGRNPYDASKIDRIMLRFRPIAPKPASSGSGEEKTPGALVRNGGGGRTKRRYVKDATKTRRKNNSKKGKPCSDQDDDQTAAVITLSLLPEKPYDGSASHSPSPSLVPPPAAAWCRSSPSPASSSGGSVPGRSGGGAGYVPPSAAASQSPSPSPSLVPPAAAWCRNTPSPASSSGGSGPGRSGGGAGYVLPAPAAWGRNSPSSASSSGGSGPGRSGGGAGYVLPAPAAWGRNSPSSASSSGGSGPGRSGGGAGLSTTTSSSSPSECTVVIPQPVRPVGSCVTVMRCVTEEIGLGFLGRTDEEKMINLEKDTCPGFISDGLGRVGWTNEAYRKVVNQDGFGSEGRPEMAWLVMSGSVPLRTCEEGFVCTVRLQYTCKKERHSMIVPCDVWKMNGGGGFAWRLDVKAALSLGR